MSLRRKSIFIGSISFFAFALLRCFVPLKNMGFFVVACTVFVIAAVLFYAISGRFKKESSDRVKKIWCVLPVAALTVWLILFYINETNTAERTKKYDFSASLQDGNKLFQGRDMLLQRGYR